MTKKELVQDLARARGISTREAREFLEAFIRTIEKALSEGESVTLRSFGRFEVRQRAGRMVRAPGTEKDVQVPARLTPVFQGSPGLGERLRAGLSQGP